MALKLTKDSIDLGIITCEPEKMLAFYRDLLGFEPKGEMPMAKGGHMYRLQCGTSMIKIVVNGRPPEARSAPGGIASSTGYRYFTITVSNLTESVQRCSAAGHKVVIPEKEIRPGLIMAMVEDPDGNWVEFLQTA